MKGYIALLGTAVVLTAVGCNKKTAEPDPTPKDEFQGLIMENLDTTVSPRENFYLYANGGYINRTKIPGDQGRWGVFGELGEATDMKVHDLAKEMSAKTGVAKGSVEQLVGDYYAAAMDTDKIEKAGIEPIRPHLSQIDGLGSTADLAPLLAKFHRQGIGAAFSIWIDLDDKNSSAYIVNFYQGGMGLPERSYYLAEDPGNADIRAKYVTYLTELFQLAGEDATKAAQSASTVMAMETRMARASLPIVALRNPDNVYHKMDLAGLSAKAPNIDWKAYFAGIGLPDPGEVNAATPEFLKEVSAMVKTQSLEEWKTYLRAVVLRSMAPYLNSAFVKTDFSFNDKVLGGAEEMRPRWKRVMDGLNGALGMAVGQAYVDKHFSPRAKEIALDMVDNILATMKDRLAELSWLSDSTRQKAIHKVSTILPKIGYPDKWRDYSKLDLSRESYVKNVLAARDFNFQYRLDKIGKPVDKAEWGMPPQIVNAYYNPSRNEIVFPAGILQPPFFHENADPAQNYGGFGAVIGHELIHAFDDQGSKFDADGNLKSWWTEDDRKHFEQRADRVRQQYDAYTVLDSLHVNGSLTLGENIADIFGLRMSYYAWKRSQKGKPAPESLNGYTPDQYFFVSFGQIWAGIMRDEYLKTMLRTNPHSPGEFRVLGSLSNLTEFYQAFGVKEGDAMWRPDSARADIW